MNGEHGFFFEAERRITSGAPNKDWLLRDAVQRCEFISEELQEDEDSIGVADQLKKIRVLQKL